MNWKEFLKPDMKKIILFLVLFSLSYFFGVSSYHGILQVVGVCYNPILWLPLAIVGGSCIFSSGGDLISIINQFPYSLGILATLLYWYFLSCLIVWIYNNIRKK